MKTDNLIVIKALQPFRNVLGDSITKIEADIRSALGREEKRGENDPMKGVMIKDGEWKASASFKITRRNGETLQLPSNAAWAVLLCFGMRINELAKNADSEIQSTIPEICKSWIAEHYRGNKSTEPKAKDVAVIV